MKSPFPFTLCSLCMLAIGCAQGAPDYFEPAYASGSGGVSASSSGGAGGMSGMDHTGGIGGMGMGGRTGSNAGTGGMNGGSSSDKDAGSAGPSDDRDSAVGGAQADASSGGAGGTGGSSAAGSGGSAAAGAGGTTAGTGGAPATDPNADCDQAMFESHSYWICNDGRSWDEARAACQSAGGDLIGIGSSGEEDFLEGELDNNRQYWIGLDQKNASGSGAADTWEWSDGSDLSAYDNWDNGEPDNQECGQIKTPLLLGRPGWQDGDCDNNERFICESL